MPSDFGGRAGSQLSISCIFLQCVLAPVSLVGGGTRGGGVRSGASSLLGGQHHSGRGRVGSPTAGAEALRFGSELVLFSAFLALAPSAQRRAVLSKKFWSRCLVWTGVCAGVLLAPVTILDHS